jgi:hypothetical protein
MRPSAHSFIHPERLDVTVRPVRPVRPFAVLIALMIAAPQSAGAQTPALPDSVLQRLWDAGRRHSALPALAQALLDSIGPRLTGSPAERAGRDWLLARYREWGVPAREERYGTWKEWRRGITHLDLVSPRVRTLEGTLLAWSRGTRGAVEAPAVLLPDVRSASAFDAWLRTARGKFVLLSAAEPTCRPDDDWARFGTRASVARLERSRAAADSLWALRLHAAGGSMDSVAARLERAGVAGLLTAYWSSGWGTTKVFDAPTWGVPALVLGCEDYGLVFRLAQHGQGPVLRLDAQAEDLGEAPVVNTLAELKGTEKPNEYVLLSAHFDSWDGGSGATDNGTGTLIMLEAMRLLRTAYPQPKRTILAAHWGGEEQGLNGSRAFGADHPEIVSRIYAGFNHDYGTGRIVRIALEGFVDAGPHAARWLSRLPLELSDSVSLENPGLPGPGGSDYASFDCRGAPVFNLISTDWSYDTYTWHTNRDTFDKIAFEDLEQSAVLTAMLAYEAAEDPTPFARTERQLFPVDSTTGKRGVWPTCIAPERSWEEGLRSR